MEMKMVTLMKMSLMLAVVAAGAVRGTSTEGAAREPSGAERAERVRKPFLYGRGFQLPKDFKRSDRRDDLYSPLITNPIRALPSNPEEEALKQNQNEIFTSIQDFMRETTEGRLNKTDLPENVTASVGQEEEATTKSVREGLVGEVNGSGLKSRQDGDRSLMVVLPFKAEGDNVEELFTKSPLVKVIENDELDGTQGASQPPVTREREIAPTTERNFITRKRWRPYRTTTEAHTTETTTETGQDVTKTYTNYDDVEQVTRKFENPTEEPQNFTNHNYDAYFVTPNPIYKRFTSKMKKGQTKTEERDQKTTTEEFDPFSSTEKPKEIKPKLKRKGQRRKPTTEGPPKPEELSKILDILPTDVKDLILQMGLNKESKEQGASGNNFRLERPTQPTIDPMSYAVFKPLPLEGQSENRNFVPDDMKDFLASFGLLPIGGRVQKSLKTEAPPSEKKPVEDLSDVNLDFLPDDLKSLLQDMGLVRSDSKKEPTRIHIFNPSNHSIAHSEEDFEKLNAILSSIKTTVNKSQSLTPEMQSEVIEKIRDLNNLRYRSANLSEINNEIKKIVVDGKNSSDTKPRTTAKRATKLNEGPDPLMFSDDSLLKNDVKRQENSTNTSSSNDTSTSASSAAASEDEAPAPTTTTEEAPNIEALKESFGGGETASDDADIESSLPPKRPNGLYLLLDWNSFLEVGTDDDSRRVNLRFQPKIGDSRNFLPVSVP